MSDDPCILFALRRESQYFLRTFHRRTSFSGAPCRPTFYERQDSRVLVLETGIGTTRTAAALESVLNGPGQGRESYRPRFVVSAGFSGALQPGCRIGDVVLATEVVDLEGGRWPVGETVVERDLCVHSGRVLAVPRLVSDPGEKRLLGQKYAALAVDMETATASRMCCQRGIPFRCVRAISDEVDTALSPRLVSLLSGGRVSPWRLLAAVAASPRLMKELWTLARHTRLAAQQLGKVLGQLVLEKPPTRQIQ